MLRRGSIVIAAVLLLVLAASCRKPLEITGTATYLARIALPAGAVLEVQLADVSRADAPAVVIAKESYTSMAGPPFPFRLQVDPKQIDPRASYAVQARILVNGRLFMVNTRRAAVDRHDPTRPVEVRLDPVPATVGE